MAHCVLKVKVSPRSSRDQVVSFVDGVLAIRLTAPPVEGEANAAVIKFIAKALGLKRSQLSIKSGLASRTKMIEIEGIGEEDLVSRIEQCLA